MQVGTKTLYMFSQVQLPKTVGVLGYGAIGKAFVEVMLEKHPEVRIVALDKIDTFFPNEQRFETIIEKRTKENLHETLNVMGLKPGDTLVDLSTNIEFLDIWTLCASNGIKYLNTALEVWEDSEIAISSPQNIKEAYELTLGFIKDNARSSKYWNNTATALLETGFNPGVISHCVKRGLEDCAKYYINTQPKDVNLTLLRKYLLERNHSKLAQTLGVHTIHCSETDNQKMENIPNDTTTKFYNTWSCRGFLTEGLVPIQVARGSHEDLNIPNCYTIRNGKTIVSKQPSVKTWAKSWVPYQNIEGVLIPHGEAYSIQDYLSDQETGYSPSQYYVYDFNPLAKQFINNLPKDATVHNTNPIMEVIHPMNHKSLNGWDKVGAMIIMNNNRGWWTGSIMDEIDSQLLYNAKFGPTVLQVVAGVYGGFLWTCQHNNIGAHFSEDVNTDDLIKIGQHLMGRFISIPVDLTTTQIKDCYKLQSFLCNPI